MAALFGAIIAQEGVRDDSHVENVVHKAVADEFDSKILTNKTTAFLSCASGEMHVKLNFSEPFRGITYVDYDKTSPCKFYGDGQRYYELRIPLKGCGTKQVSQFSVAAGGFVLVLVNRCVAANTLSIHYYSALHSLARRFWSEFLNFPKSESTE